MGLTRLRASNAHVRPLELGQICPDVCAHAARGLVVLLGMLCLLS
jgi:hypothetical protein